jgi:DNA invertase Pin-like site-specific DNA recombinase
MNTEDVRAQPRAYSYLRFSTPAQAAGDSLRRQTEKAANYAAKNGLVLDTELKLTDAGLSGYDGTNVRVGALAAFLEEVRTKRVSRGSYLLIENIDRLTRADLPDAMELFWGLINAGIVVVTVGNEQRYSRESLAAEPYAAYAIVSDLIRGNKESARKSELIAATYEKKRRDAKNGKLFTRMLPAWLRWNDTTQRIEAIPERAKVVASIYGMMAQGRSPQRIAQILNEQGVPAWERAGRSAAYWHQSYVRKLLENYAVIGTYVPHKATKDVTGRKQRTALEPIEGYYPAVVDPELFEHVRARLRSTAARGRNANTEPKSIFAGVMKCRHCGGTVSRISKGRYAYLICGKANAKAGCKYEAVPYQLVEERFCEVADWIVENAPRGRDTADLEEDIARLQATVDAMIDRAQDMADLVIQEKSEGARRQLKAVEKQIEEVEERLRQMTALRDSTATPMVTRKLKELYEALTRKPLNVTETNRAVRQVVSKIVLIPEQGSIAIYWQHAEEPLWPIVFGGRHMNWEPPSGHYTFP